MSQTTTLNLSTSLTQSAPVVRLANVRVVTKRTKRQDAQAKRLDRIVERSENNWVSHEDVKRRLGLTNREK